MCALRFTAASLSPHRTRKSDRRCRRALMETWVGRESAVFKLPPSRLALDPCDVIHLAHDGRLTEFRLISVGDAGARSIETRRQERVVYDLPPGIARAATLPRDVSFGVPEVLFLDLPQLSEGNLTLSLAPSLSANDADENSPELFELAIPGAKPEPTDYPQSQLFQTLPAPCTRVEISPITALLAR